MTLDAYYLPGLDEADMESWTTRDCGDGVELRIPVLRARVIARLAERLRSARAATLAERPVPDIIEAIDRAAARLLDPADPLRGLAERALPAVTGYSLPMVRLVLDRMAADWRAPALERLVTSELGGLDALDAFRADSRPGRRSRAYGPELSLHVFAGNVPGVGVTSMVRALLVRSAVLAKTAQAEPVLGVLFARALAESAPWLADCVAVTHWAGGGDGDREAAGHADVVIVYGGAEAVAAFRGNASATTRVIEHGPRLSVAAIGRDTLGSEADARRAAQDAARAVATFDQQGCVSPHALFVESGGMVEPRVFARMVAAGLSALEAELPRGRLDAAEAAVIHAVRATAEFRAISGEDVELIAGAGTSWTVIWAGAGEFEPTCLNRTIRVLPVASLDDVADRIGPFRHVLQTIGLAGAGPRLDRVAHALASAGATRIAPLDRMPWPAPDANHDGSSPLKELVRVVDIEE